MSLLCCGFLVAIVGRLEGRLVLCGFCVGRRVRGRHLQGFAELADLNFLDDLPLEMDFLDLLELFDLLPGCFWLLPPLPLPFLIGPLLLPLDPSFFEILWSS